MSIIRRTKADPPQTCGVCAENPHDTLCENCGRCICTGCTDQTYEDVPVCVECGMEMRKPASDDAGEGGTAKQAAIDTIAALALLAAAAAGGTIAAAAGAAIGALWRTT